MSNTILKALYGEEIQVKLTQAEYLAQLKQEIDILEEDYRQALSKTAELKREEAIEAGQPPTVVIDEKVVELEVLKRKEVAILSAGQLIVKQSEQGDLVKLFESLRGLFTVFPKARMAKITRMLIDSISQMPSSSQLQIDLCLKCIQWCAEEKRTFLRHRLQTKLAGLYQQCGMFHAGLEVLPPLLKEVKQVDDKLLLVEVYLVEAKLYFSVRHIPKAKAALTAAKTSANAIHCPPLLQADIDLVAGSLHAEEKDFRTAYSYFYEAFEAFNLQNDQRAGEALKYMMLCRIMSDQSANITNIGRGTAGLKFLELDSIKALIEIAKAYSDRSLENFEEAIKKHNDIIQEDTVLSRHIDQAAEQLLEQSIWKMVEPFGEVEISHIARKTRLSEQRIQQKLSEMILDSKVSGTLDQGRGVFILYDDAPPRKIYEDSVETFNTLREIVNMLSEKVQTVL